jgi:hypothetical protein
MREIIITTITKTEIQQLAESAVVKALHTKSTHKKNDHDAFLGGQDQIQIQYPIIPR